MSGGSDDGIGGRERWLVIVCLLIVYVVWGSTYLAIRVMVETIPPLLGAGVRFLAAGGILAAVLLVSNRDAFLSVTRREVTGAAAMGVLILVGGIGLVTVAETEVPSAITALIIASVPLFVVVLRAVHGEAVARWTVAAVAVGFVGVGGIVLPGGDTVGGGTGPMLLVIAASVCTALGAFYSSRVPTPRNALAGAVVEMAAAGCVLLGAAAVSGEIAAFEAPDVSSSSIVAFVYLVTIGSLIAYSAFVWLLDHARVSLVATYAYVNPVVALVLGAAILGEAVRTATILAAAAIVGSVFVVVTAESAQRARTRG